MPTPVRLTYLTSPDDYDDLGALSRIGRALWGRLPFGVLDEFRLDREQDGSRRPFVILKPCNVADLAAYLIEHRYSAVVRLDLVTPVGLRPILWPKP